MNAGEVEEILPRSCSERKDRMCSQVVLSNILAVGCVKNGARGVWEGVEGEFMSKRESEGVGVGECERGCKHSGMIDNSFAKFCRN